MFCGLQDRSFASSIVVPAPSRRKPLVATASVASGVGGERVEGELALKALADQSPEGAVALPAFPGGRGKAPAQQGQRAVKFGLLRRPLGLVTVQRGLDQLTVDAALSEPAADPLTPPAFEFALVVDEHQRVAGVVHVALRLELAQARLSDFGADSLALELSPQLVGRALAPVQEREAELQPPLEPLVLGGLRRLDLRCPRPRPAPARRRARSP